MLFRKTISSILYLIIVSICTFFLSTKIPGDPAEKIANIGRAEPAPSEIVEKVRQEYALDRPVLEQYLSWLKHVIVHGNFGKSFQTALPVTTEIRRSLPATLQLAGLSFVLTILISLPLGTIAAISENKWIELVIQVLALLGYAIPVFLVGNLLLWLFSVRLGWLPSIGRSSWYHSILPVATLSFNLIGWSTQIIHACVKEQVTQFFIVVAKAKGVPQSLLIKRYILRPALIPVLTMFLMMFSHLISGSFMTEVIFAWNGMGRLLIDAVMARDYPLIQGIVMYIGGSLILINLLIDLLYARLDPQIGEQLQGTAVSTTTR